MFTLRRTATALLPLAFLMPLAACGDKAEEKAVEKALENAGDGDVDVDVDGDDVTITGEDGSFSSSSELPDSFPTDEIPLFDGTIQSSIAGDQGGGTPAFLILMTVDDGEAAFAEAVSLLEGAGFIADEGGTIAGMSATSMSTAKYTIILTLLPDPENATLSYAIEVK